MQLWGHFQPCWSGLPSDVTVWGSDHPHSVSDWSPMFCKDNLEILIFLPLSSRCRNYSIYAGNTWSVWCWGPNAGPHWMVRQAFHGLNDMSTPASFLFFDTKSHLCSPGWPQSLYFSYWNSSSHACVSDWSVMQMNAEAERIKDPLRGS